MTVTLTLLWRADGAEKRKRKRNAQKLFFNKKNTERKEKLQDRLNMLCEDVVVDAQSDFNKGVVVRLCVDVSTK